jgi:C4-dicarboxylate transporter, DctM subunit
MITVYITSVRRGYPTQPRASFKAVVSSLGGAWSAILAPVIVVGGILTGVFTPTEASVAACFYGAFISIFLYREVSFRRLLEILAETADQTIRVLFIIATAGLFGWLLIQQRVPDAVIQFLLSLTTDPKILLLIINVILLVLGCFMEAISIMLLTIPIFMPLVAKVGIDPVHFGVMMTFNLMIALLTPPVGMVLYTVSCIGQVPLWKLAGELKWHIVALIVCLFLISYIPGIVTWLPTLVMG